MSETIGLAKYASQPKGNSSVSPTSSDPIGYEDTGILGVPKVLYSLFGVNPKAVTRDEVGRMKFVDDHFKGMKMSEKIRSVKHIYRKLGMGGVQPMLSKVYNYIRMSQEIKEMKSIQKAMES